MSYKEAVEDNIPHEKSNGFNYYYPSCHICGEGVKSWGYIRGMKYTCSDCKAMMFLFEQDKKRDLTIEQRKLKLKRATNRISKVANILNYHDAIYVAENTMNNSNWFQSTEEVMVGLQLLKKNVKFETQFKVGPYSCDFYLPNFNVVLEIDGDLFHTKDKKEKEVFRDSIIEDKLGNGLMVLRIKTSFINMNVTRVTNAIYALQKFKKKLTVADS